MATTPQPTTETTVAQIQTPTQPINAPIFERHLSHHRGKICKAANAIDGGKQGRRQFCRNGRLLTSTSIQDIQHSGQNSRSVQSNNDATSFVDDLKQKYSNILDGGAVIEEDEDGTDANKVTAKNVALCGAYSWAAQKWQQTDDLCDRIDDCRVNGYMDYATYKENECEAALAEFFESFDDDDDDDDFTK